MRVEVLRVSHPYTLHELREEGLLPKGGGAKKVVNGTGSRCRTTS